MIRAHTFGLVVISSLALGACGDDSSGVGGAGAGGGPPAALTFAPMGSLVAPSGKGSFRFGAASAATQIEDANDRTDWWFWTAPESQGGLDRGTFVGDASQGHARALEDVGLLTAMHLDSYRFSVEWSRIEPQRDVIDEEALAHYGALLDALVAAGVRPMITVHHFSNPVWVSDPRGPDCADGPTDENLCGFDHPEGGLLVVEEMREHAALLAERFGDRVDEWGTVNEPVNYLLAGYGLGSFPPGKQEILSEEGLLDRFVPTVRTFLRFHAAAYHAIKESDLTDADGDGAPADVGFTLSVGSFAPTQANAPSTAVQDVEAAARVDYVYNHLFVEATRQGRFDADLDGTLEEELPEVGGTVDWLGVQYYFRAGVTGTLATGAPGGVIPVVDASPCFSPFDFGACLPIEDPSKCVPAMRYEYYEPGIYDLLRTFSARWPDLPLLVSESGIATEVGRRRSQHVVRSLEQIARARDEGVDVRGYYHWSLFDNFEWAEGFGPRFGLYRVDYATFARSPTEGATTLGEIALARSITTQQRTGLGGLGPMDPEGDGSECP